MELSSPSCRIDPIEHGHDQGRVVYPKTPVQTDNLPHGRDSQKDKREDRRKVSELISRVLMRERTRDKLHSRFREHETHPCKSSPTTRPTDAQRPSDLRVIVGRSPLFQPLFHPEQPGLDPKFHLGYQPHVIGKPPPGADARKRLCGQISPCGEYGFQLVREDISRHQ